MTDVTAGVMRLEKALYLLKECGDDWSLAYQKARNLQMIIDEDNWQAICDLIVISTHGAPELISYLQDDAMVPANIMKILRKD